VAKGRDGKKRPIVVVAGSSEKEERQRNMIIPLGRCYTCQLTALLGESALSLPLLFLLVDE
jgi:hypothetical protein